MSKRNITNKSFNEKANVSSDDIITYIGEAFKFN